MKAPTYEIVQTQIPVSRRASCFGCDWTQDSAISTDAGYLNEIAYMHAEMYGHVTRVVQDGPGVQFSREVKS